jgi:2-polyprenyl-6-methoxyphenol hydroxylase-like FAD-dependent oxidoreductase
MMPSTTDVLVVGAGPTGLALAIGLQQAGIAHVLIDAQPAGRNTSRAAVIHAHMLEMLDGLGVSARLAAEGLKLTTFTIRDRDRRLLRIPFDRLPTRHPYLLMLPQDATERILTDRLLALGGRIFRGVTATGLREGAAGVEAALESNDGEQTITARIGVGADGMHSVVRETIGTEFTGSTYGESFVLADVRMNWSHGRDDVQLFFSPEGLVVVAPLPGGSFRIVATLDDAPEQPTARDIQALVHARGPARGTSEVTEVLWSSRFRVHHRLADSYGDRSLFLIGDAAHVHSPAGGQGMNTGLVDAVVLGQMIVRALRGAPADAIGGRYQRLRRPAAEQVLGLAGRLTSLATMKHPVTRTVRNVLLTLLDHAPPAKRALAMNLSGLSRRRFTGSMAPSDPARPTERPGRRVLLR